MKAIVIHEHGGPEVLRLEDVPQPEAGPGEAVVRVRACALNRLDLYTRAGRTRGFKLPHIMGSEVAGEVAEVGPGVAAVAVGQRVAVAPYLHDDSCEFCLRGEETICLRGDILGLATRGGYAEYVKVPVRQLVPLPQGLGFEEAAASTLSTPTAWRMLRRADIRPGETVLVWAAGSGIGSAAIQIARLLGGRVFATAGSAEKLERARELGAEATINHREQDVRQTVRELTGKRGVDVVVEHVGQATWEQSVACLARNGRLVTCGATTGNEGKLDIWSLFAKQLQVIGAYGATRGEVADVLALVAQGRLRPVMHQVLPLEQAAEAHKILEASGHFGKIILSM